MAAGLTIGEVARRAGLATSAIRYYEREGLLPRAPRVSGRRRYGPQVLERLSIIAMAKRAGFTLQEIRTLLGGMGGGRRATQRLAALANRKLPEIEASIQRLQQIHRLLQAAAHCQCPSLSACARRLDAGSALMTGDDEALR